MLHYRHFVYIPAVVGPGPGQVVEKVAVVGGTVPHLLHRNELLILDVEDEVAVGLLLLDVVPCSFFLFFNSEF